jgi:hypothetical protein
MIYLNHDIYSNISASLKSGDHELTTDILVNEISDFIVYDTAKFIEVLNKSGIQASEKMPDETLVDLFLKNLPVNKSLSKAMGFQVADSNGLVNSGGGNKTKQLAVIEVISTGISNIANKINDNSDLAKTMKSDIMNQIVSKSKAKGNYQRTIFNPTSKIIYWVLGGLILVGVGYFLYRRRKLKLEAGGAIPAPIQVDAPVAPATPQPVSIAPNVVTPIQGQTNAITNGR